MDKAIRQVEKEIANLTASLKAVGPADELVKEMTVCQVRKTDLVVKRQERLSLVLMDVGNIDMEEVRECLKDLQQTLQFATPEERKSLMRENVNEIRIPERGKLLLASSPEGLLASVSSLFHLVTLRGVHKKVPKVKARPESICKLDLARIDLRKKANRKLIAR